MNEEIKKVSWLELFYDLAFIALIAQLTYAVADHHKSFTDIFLVGLIGYMIFIAWLGTTVSRNINATESTRDKLLIQLQMVLAFFMSLTLPGMFEGDLAPFFLSFALIRALQLYIVRLGYKERPEEAPKTKNVFWGSATATALWCIAGFITLPYAFIIASMALVIDILSPLTKGEGNTTRMLNIPHLQERLGLFLILVMGESMLVVALANTVTSLGVAQPIIVLSGVILMIALWWTYFGYLEKCAEGRRPNNMLLYLHAHAFLFGGVVVLSAAYKNFLKHEELLMSDQLLLTGGVLLISCTMIIIRNTLETKNMMRTGAMRAMAIGIPLVGYIGYQTGEIVYSLALTTLWVTLAAIYDERKRM